MSKLNPLITVYITNFNYGQFIKKAINSVLNQTLKNLTINYIFKIIIFVSSPSIKNKF